MQYRTHSDHKVASSCDYPITIPKKREKQQTVMYLPPFGSRRLATVFCGCGPMCVTIVNFAYSRIHHNLFDSAEPNRGIWSFLRTLTARLVEYLRILDPSRLYILSIESCVKLERYLLRSVSNSFKSGKRVIEVAREWQPTQSTSRYDSFEITLAKGLAQHETPIESLDINTHLEPFKSEKRVIETSGEWPPAQSIGYHVSSESTLGEIPPQPETPVESPSINIQLIPIPSDKLSRYERRMIMSVASINLLRPLTSI